MIKKSPTKNILAVLSEGGDDGAVWHHASIWEMDMSCKPSKLHVEETWGGEDEEGASGEEIKDIELIDTNTAKLKKLVYSSGTKRKTEYKQIKF